MSTSRKIQSLSNAQLDAELAKYGAATFGSTERKRQRLQRFRRAQDERIAEAYWAECEAHWEANNQQPIHETYDTEEEPPLKRQRIETCPSPDSAPAPAPVRRPAPPPARMTTRSMTAAQRPPSPARRRSHPMLTRAQMSELRPSAQDALQRIRSLIAEFLA